MHDMSDQLRAMLIRHEELRLRLYPDSAVPPKLTIGVGHNIEDNGITEAVAYLILDEDIKTHTDLLTKYLPWWQKMNDARRDALADMAFNLGVGPSKEQPKGKLLTFKRTLAHMQVGQFDLASNSMLASLWAKQVGNRAIELALMIRSGQYA